MNKIKLNLVIVLLILSVTVFFILPNIGLYFCCTSILITCFLLIKTKFDLRILISVILSSLTFLVMIDKAYELQGWKVVKILFDYYHDNNTTPVSLEIDKKLMINSFTPLFDKYQYDNDYDTTKYFFFKLSYTDIWGREYYYDDKDGEFRIRK